MIEIRKTLLVTGAVISFVAPTVLEAAPVRAPLVLLAQADATDAVASAQAAVAAAQAALRAALASGTGVDEARAALAQALQALEQARLAAGLPPSDPSALQPVLPEESAAPPAAEQPQPPPPPADQQPAPPPAAEQPPVVDQTPPPPAAEQTPPAEVAPVPPPQQKPPRTKPAVPPANIQNPPPPVDQTQPPAPPPADQVVPPPPADQVVPPPSAEQTPPPATGQQPPATTEPSPVVNLPPPVIETPPPPPPPAATQQQGTFDLNKFQNRPKFGAVPPAEAAKEPPPAALPSSEAAVKDGAVIQAQDGRVIVKEGGQVTVKHDDSGRFVRQGDQLNTQRTGNDTETTTVTRPDGSQIVTVRDKFGNIIQRYRKNPNGSVDVLIGDMEQPGIFGRIFGQGPQPAPPRPRPDNRPPIVNLNLGPIQLNIPQQDYIVESSRANRQQLEQTLLAPPVERVERTYTLEEIRQNGRLRDKVRRIDFDTITFDTAQATVPDDQIAKMQTIGTALRDIIQRDPTQVFLIEGHTDAVGSDLYNLALSDRRAETVAQILSYYYGIPAENLVTQGYGEQFLKVPTTAANRDNRRVAFRNITPLMRTSSN